MTRFQIILLALPALLAFAGGCGNRLSSAAGGTPSSYTVKATSDQIQQIQNDPNIPPDRKAGILAALQGDKNYRATAPSGAAPSYASSKRTN